MVFVLPIILKYWSIFWIIGFILIFLRTDAKPMLVSVFNGWFSDNIGYIFLCMVFVYIMLPLTIPFSIINIIKNE